MLLLWSSASLNNFWTPIFTVSKLAPAVHLRVYTGASLGVGTTAVASTAHTAHGTASGTAHTAARRATGHVGAEALADGGAACPGPGPAAHASSPGSLPASCGGTSAQHASSPGAGAGSRSAAQTGVASAGGESSSGVDAGSGGVGVLPGHGCCVETLSSAVSAVGQIGRVY